MYRKQAMILVFVLIALFIFFNGCGGSKETVKYEPDPFPDPEPEVTEEVSKTAIEEPAPVVENVAKREPVNLMTIHFDFDKSDLNPEAKALLAANARKLNDNPKIKVRIEGHCDELGTVEYNLALGQRRAIVTRNYLVNFGLDPGRFTIISYGKERPVNSGHTPAALSENRRAEFIKINE